MANLKLPDTHVQKYAAAADAQVSGQAILLTDFASNIIGIVDLRLSSTALSPSNCSMTQGTGCFNYSTTLEDQK